MFPAPTAPIVACTGPGLNTRLEVTLMMPWSVCRDHLEPGKAKTLAPVLLRSLAVLGDMVSKISVDRGRHLRSLWESTLLHLKES